MGTPTPKTRELFRGALALRARVNLYATQDFWRHPPYRFWILGYSRRFEISLTWLEVEQFPDRHLTDASLAITNFASTLLII